MEHSGVGRHAICEFWGASHLDSTEIAEQALRDATVAGHVTLLDVFVHQFAPHGVSGIAVIAESHLAIHTWPEYGYMAADFFTCGDDVDMDAIITTLSTAFEAERVDVRFLDRGVPGGVGAERFEEAEPASAGYFAYDVAEVLEQRRTDFQDLLLFQSPRLGKVLALDGIVQMTDLDTYVYHEVLAHPALHAHANPRAVAVVGGGDVFVVAEVLKHASVEKIYLLELDEEVVRIACKHYDIARIALNDPRVEFIAGDAFESIDTLAGELDVIMVDLTDPIGPAARLFEDGFYALCQRALRPGGILVAQTESLHFHSEWVKSCFAALQARFAQAEVLWGAIATYPGAFWTFGIATDGDDLRVCRRRPDIETRLYDADAHAWFFVPETVRRKLIGA